MEDIVVTGRLTFLVNGKYTVDLEEHNHFGRCDCPDWCTRKWPMIRDGQEPSEKTQCKHCRMVERFLLNQIYERIKHEAGMA